MLFGVVISRFFVQLWQVVRGTRHPVPGLPRNAFGVVISRMCLFPLPNTSYNSPAYKKGIQSFDCGACPECLQHRTSRLALRDVYEASTHAHNCMVTLTYDSYKYDNSFEEKTPDPDIIVNKRHIQLFIKRLRKHFTSLYGPSYRLKYRVCAEYGSRTHRAHYHCLLFNVHFSDIVPYKKSARGNQIYQSATLTRLWSHGICTVDNPVVTEATARYVSKYTAKTRSPGTFMLCSQHIGVDALYSAFISPSFNGHGFYSSGRLYPVPRPIWERYIVEKYRLKNKRVDPRYVPKPKDGSSLAPYFEARVRRQVYRHYRDNDPLYKEYLSYWSSAAELYSSTLPPVSTRLQLLSTKFPAYYNEALFYLSHKNKYSLPPRSKVGAAQVEREYYYTLRSFGLITTLPYVSCLHTASDTTPQSPALVEFKNTLSRGLFLLRGPCSSPFDTSFQLEI